MTTDRRLEPLLPSILADLGDGPAPDYVDLVLERTSTAGQRPGWLFPNRWFRFDAGAPAAVAYRLRPALVLALVALLVVALVGAAIFIGSRPHLPAPFGLAENGAVVHGADGDIFLADASGTGVRPVVTGDAYDFAPFFSPDGTRFAFLRRVDPAVFDGPTDLVVALADGSDVSVITRQPLLEIPWSVAWKPDSSAVAVLTSPRLDGMLELFDANRAAAPQVIDPGLHIDSFAFQPPAGDRIAFRGLTGFQIGLYTMSADGSDVRTLVEPYIPPDPPDWVSDPLNESVKTWGFIRTSPDLRNPAWSPDGKRLVFQQTVYADGSPQSQLFLVNADGSDSHSITSGHGLSLDLYPTWSPAGDRLAFERFDAATRTWTFAVLRLSDGKVTKVGPTSPDGLVGLSWSPDGTSLLLVEHSGDRRAWLVDPETGVPHAQSWSAETAGYWDQRNALNGLDPGSWQRKASP